MGLQFSVSLLSHLLYMVNMIPVLEVTLVVSSFPQESQTSKETGASSFKQCL